MSKYEEMRLLVSNIQVSMHFFQILVSVGQNSVNFRKNNGYNGFVRNRSKLILLLFPTLFRMANRRKPWFSTLSYTTYVSQIESKSKITWMCSILLWQ